MLLFPNGSFQVIAQKISQEMLDQQKEIHLKMLIQYQLANCQPKGLFAGNK